MTDAPAGDAAIRFALDAAALLATRRGRLVAVATWSHPAPRVRDSVEVWVDSVGAVVVVHGPDRGRPIASWQVPLVAVDTEDGRAVFAKRLESRVDLAASLLDGKRVAS